MEAKSLRADARDNRDHIVAAALALFRERGIDVPMKEVADRAGVGVGTLYRRFPDRDALIAATARAHLTGLAEAAGTAWREEGEAWPALARFLRECVGAGLGAVAAALEPSLHTVLRSDPELDAMRVSVTDVVARLVEQAKADGAMRADADVHDIALLLTVRVYTRPEESRADAIHRVTTILLDGLRPR